MHTYKNTYFMLHIFSYTNTYMYMNTYMYVRTYIHTCSFHRYFAHASFKTNRFFQAIMAIVGAFSNQRGALW